MDIDVEALGGERNEGQGGTLLIAPGGGSLRGYLGLMLGVDSSLSDTDDRLFLLMAGDK
jgi:hypothetical protein